MPESGPKTTHSIVPKVAGEDEPIFKEPWEARVFALAVALNEGGHLDWNEWAQSLGAERNRDRDDDDYYQDWLNALEQLLVDNCVVSTHEIAARVEEWQKVLRETPHGKPLVLAKRS